MASTYSTLKLELIAVGETGSTGNWGTTTNNNLGDTTSTTRGIEQAIGGFSAVTLTTTSTTLAYTNTTANQDFRSLFLSFSGSPGAASTVIIPSTSIQKLYIIKNSISGGYSLTVKYAASTGTVVPNGSTVILYANGTDVIPGQDYIPSLTLGSALPVTSGGTGVTTSTGTGSVVLSAAPTLTSPSLSAETFSTSASVTAGTNAQGQGALTSDYNVITTAAANPSGVTLPAATTGRRVVIVNKGANPINVYPATSAYIDGNAINASIQIIANGVMIFNASSATQWYSSYNLMTPSSTGAVSSFSAGSTGLTPNTASTGNIVLAGTLATSNGGTGLSGATPFTANGAVYASSASALTTGTLPVASGGTGITSFGTGVATFLGTPSSANLAAAVTDETGTGSLVFGTAPTLSAPVLTSPSLSAETFSTAATVTAGTNAQGQGALTNDYNVITTAASNPSGVTLPTATTGRRIVIVNKGANAVNVYPASGGTIDALAANAAISLTVGGVMIFNASSTTQWYSSYNLYTSATAAAGVTSFSAGTTGFTPSSATPGAITLSGTLNVLNGGTGVTTSTGSGNNVLSNSPTLVTPVLGTPSSGTLTNCTSLPVSTGISGLGTGVATFLATPSSANLAAAVTDETGSGALVFATSPTLVTPALGTPASGVLTNTTGLPISTGVSGLGTNVATALATNVGSAGAVVVNGGVLGTPSSGTLTNCTSLPISSGVSGLGTGVATFLGTPSSANLAAAVTDETGSGSLVFGTSPSLTTPALSGETFSTSSAVSAAGTTQGTATAITSDYNVITTAATNSGVVLPTATTGRRIVVVNKGANAVNIYPATGGAIDALGANVAITLTSGGVMEFNASSTTQWYSSYNLYTSASAAAGVTSFSAGTTGFTPSSATPGAITLSGTLNVANGGTGITSFGTGVATFLGTPSSANLAAAVTDETGSGSLVFATSPTLVTPALGTPSSGTLTSCTGLPISTGVSGLGTGVATALAVNTGSAGAVVVNGGSLGTPSSGTLSSCSGLPISTGVSGLGTNVATALAVNVGSAGAVVVNGGALGTPSSGTLTNATGLPISTGVSGLGTNVATFLATPTSANLALAVTNETGSGSLVFSTSPTLVTPVLGTPTSGTLSNCDSLPLSTGVTGQLSVSNGGTGTSSLTANNVLLGNGTSAVQVVAPSTAGNILASNGTTWVSSTSGYGFSNISTAVYPSTVVNTTGTPMANTGTGTFTFTVPANARKIKVTVVGGGGSGASASSSITGGGGGGGSAINIISCSPGDVATITVGFGGTAPSGTANGAAGGTSTFAIGATTITCTGGAGGSSTATVVGGTGTGGDISIQGGNGVNPNTSGYASGGGGGTLLSPGQGGTQTGGTPAQRTGIGYGCGGAGGWNGNGGNGATGIIIVEY